MKYSSEIFEQKASLVHNNKYIYHQDYLDSLTPVKITCPIHGDFSQIPSSHLRGYGCPKCANKKRGKHSNLDEFITKAKAVHGDKYDLSKFVYNGADTKGTVICPIHGEFEIRPMSFLNGSGCPKCAGRNKTREEVIEKFREVHGDTYNYDDFVFTKMKTPSCIICKKHGVFLQRPDKHLQGHGCHECGKERRRQKQFCTQEEFIKRGRAIHCDKDDFSNVRYVSMDNKVELICKKHGSYFIRPYDYLQGHRCPKCGLLISKSEDEIYDYIIKHCNNSMGVIRNDRTILDGKEIDILVKGLNIGIEYNGLKWHSEEYGKDRMYHLNKLNTAKLKGIKLIQIYEDEYLQHKDIVLSKLSHILGFNNNKEKIMGRKCHVNEINKKDAMVFLNKHHIQGYGKSTLSLGCFYNSQLIGVMSFTKHKMNKWELIRFATDINYVCQGIGGKLFKYFIKKYNPYEVKTFADRRWTIDADSNLYTKLGFVFDDFIKPDYKYIHGSDPHERIHKFNMRKQTLHKKYGLPLTMTENEMVKKLNYYKIWDCGLIRYMWNNKKMGSI